MEPRFGLYVILEPIKFAGQKLKEAADTVKVNGNRRIIFEYVPQLPAPLEADIFEFTTQNTR